MTIGPTPPRHGPAHDFAGGPPIVPVMSSDTAGTPDGFAQALQAAGAANPRFGGTQLRASVERFNEHGFFANADAVSASGVEPPVADGGTPANGPPALPVAAISSFGSIDPAEPNAAAAINACSAPVRIAGPGEWTGAERLIPATSGRASSTTVVGPMPPRASPASEGIELETNVVPTRATGARPPWRDTAKSPVSVTLDRSEGTAAVSVSVRGLTDRQIDALRSDIATLLRRHGLTLDDLKLNGRPMGRGNHDRSRG